MGNFIAKPNNWTVCCSAFPQKSQIVQRAAKEQFNKRLGLSCTERIKYFLKMEVSSSLRCMCAESLKLMIYFKNANISWENHRHLLQEEPLTCVWA